MTNEMIANIYTDVYRWWMKWSKRNPYIYDVPIWQQMVSEMCALFDKYNHEALVVDMVNDLADELERRARQDDKEGGIENAKL